MQSTIKYQALDHALLLFLIQKNGLPFTTPQFQQNYQKIIEKVKPILKTETSADTEKFFIELGTTYARYLVHRTRTLHISQARWAHVIGQAVFIVFCINDRLEDQLKLKAILPEFLASTYAEQVYRQFNVTAKECRIYLDKQITIPAPAHVEEEQP